MEEEEAILNTPKTAKAMHSWDITTNSLMKWKAFNRESWRILGKSLN